MRKPEILTLLDYSYWANRQLLAAAGGVPVEEFTAPTTVTYRNLRGTLVHTLDVERSWRMRLRGEKPELWEPALPDEDYPAVDDLAEHWRRDEEEMRAWVEGLEDEILGEIVDLGGKDRFPLWCFLLHILTHSSQQRRDVVVVLESLGHTAPEIEFLNYADWLEESGRSPGGKPAEKPSD